MPRYERSIHNGGYYCPPDIIRYFKKIKGRPQFKIAFKPGLNYAQGETLTELSPEYLKCSSQGTSYETIYVYASFELGKVMRSQTIVLEKDGFILLSYNQKILPLSLEDIYLQLQKLSFTG